MSPAVLVKVGSEAVWQARRLVAFGRVAGRAGRAGRAAAARMRAIPRTVLVRLADPSSVLAAHARHLQESRSGAHRRLRCAAGAAQMSGQPSASYRRGRWLSGRIGDLRS
jgi:hypothetical protein